MKTTNLTILLILIPSLLFPYSFHGINFFEDYRDDDYLRQMIFAFLVMKDTQQTLTCLERNKYDPNQRCKELNPIIGENPTEDEVRKYMLGVIILHSFGIWVIDSRARESVQMFSIGVESHQVWINYRLGF